MISLKILFAFIFLGSNFFIYIFKIAILFISVLYIFSFGYFISNLLVTELLYFSKLENEFIFVCLWPKN